MSERALLLESTVPKVHGKGLSVLFSIICIVDIFGVFPVVALPKAIISCGYYGIILVVSVCSIQVYTAILLGKCWVIAEEIDPTIHKKNRYPYSALAEMTFGKILSKFVTFLLDLTIFGGGIPNLIVAAQNLQLLGQRISNNSFDVSFCYWMIIAGAVLCPILWLGSPKDMKLLCSISVGIVITVFLLIFACLINSNFENKEDFTPSKPLWQTLLASYGIIAFQFDIHPTILTIQVDMEDKRKLNKAVIGGFLISLAMFSVITIIATVKFGQSTQPSILETLSTSIPSHIAAILVAIQLGLTSAISNSALYQHVEDCLEISRAFNHRRCILRTGLTLFAILIAESVPRFDLVMSMIGGTLTAPLMFMLPPLFYLRMLVLQEKHKKQLSLESFANIIHSTEKPKFLSEYYGEKFRDDFRLYTNLNENVNWFRRTEVFVCFLIVGMSLVSTGLNTYISVNNAWEFANFTQSCIYNVSFALIH